LPVANGKRLIDDDGMVADRFFAMRRVIFMMYRPL
jgi:hypothetical protein